MASPARVLASSLSLATWSGRPHSSRERRRPSASTPHEPLEEDEEEAEEEAEDEDSSEAEASSEARNSKAREVSIA